MRFGTYTALGMESQFDSKTFEPQRAGAQLHSLLKFSGQALPKMYLYAEFEGNGGGNNNLFVKDELEFGDGVRHFFTDIPSNPISYFLGGNSIAIGHLRMTLQNSWINTDLGYKYSKLPSHQNALWKTLDDSWDAGWSGNGGFAVFSKGEKLKRLGPIHIKSILISPNKSADRAGNQYGFFGQFSGQYAGHNLDFQYNGGYGRSWDSVFDEVYEADFILGYSSKIGGVGIQANALYNVWGAEKKEMLNPDESITEYRQFYTPQSSDVSNVDPEADSIDNMAAALKFSYNLNIWSLYAGYRIRGAQANMMYVKQADGDNHISDQLGGRNTQRVYAGFSVKPSKSLNAGTELASEYILSKDAAVIPYNDPGNAVFEFKPWADYNLREIRLNAKVYGYAEMSLRTAESDYIRRGGNESPFLFSKLGLKVETGSLSAIVRGLEVLCGFDNQNDQYFYNTYLGTIKLPQNLNIQAGGMARIPHPDVPESDYPVGLYLGMTKRVPTLGRPVFYSHFQWNMDPYKGFNDGFEIDNDGYLMYGPADYQGLAVLRLGLRWDL
jgi:hypothetical protein